MRNATIVAFTALFCAPALAAKRPPPITQAPPVVYVPAFESERYGSWVVERLKNGSYAASVTNDAGSLLGAVCDHSGCSTFVKTGSTCKDKDRYPVLINAPAGAYNVMMLCGVINSSYLLFFEEDKYVLDAMSVGGVIGVATPMESGEFKVSRFSLTGAARAYARASQLGGAPANRDSRPAATDDTRL